MYDKNNKPLQRSYKSSFFSNELVDINENTITIDDNMAHEFSQLLKLNSTFVKFEQYEQNQCNSAQNGDEDKINENEESSKEETKVKHNNESGLISLKHELSIDRFESNKIILKNHLPDTIVNKLKAHLGNKISVSLFTQSVIMPNQDQLSEPTEKWSSIET